ncbi:trimeric intracellular cation channel family protein [Saccharothrix saharensis]|uniref:trimeric intracellular cation channel family protein n=1 Tax=Saccharothrix saharensis TaxID=571190 RepID=UPI00368EF5FF
MFVVMEVLGIFAFAFAGAMDAARSRLDLFGIGTAAILTAIGGGVLRDILLGVEPPIGLLTAWYFVASLAIAAIVALWYPRLWRFDMPLRFCDAVGLAMFAITGATRAMEHGTPVYVAGIIGMINAVGGGLMREVLVMRVPTMLHKEIYALPAFGGGILVGLGFTLHLPPEVVAVVTAQMVVIVRMLAVIRKWNLPTARIYRTRNAPSRERRPDPVPSALGLHRQEDVERTLEMFPALSGRQVIDQRTAQHPHGKRVTLGAMPQAQPRRTGRPYDGRPRMTKDMRLPQDNDGGDPVTAPISTI